MMVMYPMMVWMFVCDELPNVLGQCSYIEGGKRTDTLIRMKVVKTNITVLLLGIIYNTYDSDPVASLAQPPPTVDLIPVALLIESPPIIDFFPEAMFVRPPEMVLESDR